MNDEPSNKQSADSLSDAADDEIDIEDVLEETVEFALSHIDAAIVANEDQLAPFRARALKLSAARDEVLKRQMEAQTVIYLMGSILTEHFDDDELPEGSQAVIELLFDEVHLRCEQITKILDQIDAQPASDS